jgi:hypothetical protein
MPCRTSVCRRCAGSSHRRSRRRTRVGRGTVGDGLRLLVSGLPVPGYRSRARGVERRRGASGRDGSGAATGRLAARVRGGGEVEWWRSVVWCGWGNWAGTLGLAVLGITKLGFSIYYGLNGYPLLTPDSPEINSGIQICHPMKQTGISGAGCSASGAGFPGSGFGFRVLCPA